MNTSRNGAKRGFTLVELLAVVLVLAVLAAIAVPLYLNTRKTSAARVCKGNINAIATAEATYATRFGFYAAGASGNEWAATYAPAATAGNNPTGGLIGAPEGLAQEPTCPLDSSQHYTITQANATSDLIITCPLADQHEQAITGNSSATAAEPGPWKQHLKPSGKDNSNPL